MRKALALTVFLAMAPYANAQDTKADFSHNAEFRTRYKFDQNIEGNKDTGPESQSAVNHRFKFGTTFKASDKMSATLGLLHRSTWGSDSTTGLEDGTAANVGDNQNMILVQEAYGTWMMSDEFTLKFGRAGFTMADGALVSANDWQQDPTTFEGVLGTYELEAVSIKGFFVRFAELDGAGGTTNRHDPEANSFGASFDLKSLPAFLNAANIHVLQVNRDQSAAGAGSSSLRYGLYLAGAASMIDYKANYEGHTGEQTGDIDLAGMMYQVELGANFEEFMKSRVYVLYHMDSGDDGASATENEGYDNFYYEEHSNAGLMDVVGWGNLTQISVGYTLEPADATTVGLHYHMFSKSEETSAWTAQDNGTALLAASNGAGKDIGNEVDLVATQTYDNGLMVTGRLGMFMPGEVLKDATPETKDTYTQAFLEAKMSF